MATLHLIRLFCQVPEDAGTDEAYLVANGAKVWGQKSISGGQNMQINQQVNFANSVEIKLFDADGPFDNDDYLGTITVTSALKGKGEQKGKFTEEGANYSLYYRVV
jgi:hypothetical protein